MMLPKRNIATSTTKEGEHLFEVEPRSRKIKNAAKRKAHKIRDRTVPLSKKQKRSRWIPGKRYIIFLWLQSLMHPFAVFFRALRGKFRPLEYIDIRRQRHHQIVHRKVGTNETIDVPHVQMKIVSKENELLIE